MNTQVSTFSAPSAQRAGEVLKRYIALLGMIAVVVMIAAIKPALISPNNVQTIVVQAAVLCVLAVGLACAMSMKAIDLSVAACADLLGYIAAMLVIGHVPLLVAILICTLIAVAIGLFNGVMSGYLGVPAIVATLAMNLLLTAVLLVISNNGAPIQLFTRGSDPYVRSLLMIGNGFVGPISLLVILTIVIVLVMWFMTSKTSWGRRIDLLESNAKAAYLSGVPTRFVFMSGFVVSAVIAGFAGIMLASRTGVAVPGNATPMLLEAFTAVYVGAIVCPSGRIRVVWTVVGALFVTVLANGLTLLGLGAEWRTGLNGLLIIGALAISAVKRRQAGR